MNRPLSTSWIHDGFRPPHYRPVGYKKPAGLPAVIIPGSPTSPSLRWTIDPSKRPGLCMAPGVDSTLPYPRLTSRLCHHCDRTGGHRLPHLWSVVQPGCCGPVLRHSSRAEWCCLHSCCAWQCASPTSIVEPYLPSNDVHHCPRYASLGDGSMRTNSPPRRECARVPEPHRPFPEVRKLPGRFGAVKPSPKSPSLPRKAPAQTGTHLFRGQHGRKSEAGDS